MKKFQGCEQFFSCKTHLHSFLEVTCMDVAIFRFNNKPHAGMSLERTGVKNFEALDGMRHTMNCYVKL